MTESPPNSLFSGYVTVDYNVRTQTVKSQPITHHVKSSICN